MSKRLLPLVLLVLGTAPARADVAEVVAQHILPGYAAFADSTEGLDKAARDCVPETMLPAYQAAFDAWIGVAHLHLGPADEEGRALAIAFWPDPKGLGWKHQQALLTGDPALLQPAAFAEQSVAARGLFALERLLFPSGPIATDPCPLIRASAADLARLAAEIEAGWQGGYADVLLTAGDAGNDAFLSPQEARAALFTQLATGLEFVADQRLGRPLGTFDRPAPEKAEARAAGRSLRNVVLSLRALRGLAETLAPEAAQTLAGFDRVIAEAGALEDPVLAGVADPQGRLKVEILQQSVRSLREVAVAEIGARLGVEVGFNAADGD
jgi:hypothetical protein